MITLSFSSLQERVLTSRECVPFTHVDAYGHLGAPRYVDYAINHRAMASEMALGFSISDLQRGLGLGFVVKEIRATYLSPARLHEWVEIGSWITAVSFDRFDLAVVLAHEQTRRTRAAFHFVYQCVEVTTGKTVPLPDTLPCALLEDPVARLPLARDYLRRLKGRPGHFFDKNSVSNEAVRTC